MIPSFRLDGQAAVVTGASTGLGAIIAESLAEAGCAVVCAARRTTLLDDVVQRIRSAGGRAVAHRCDVTDPAHADELVAVCRDAFGRLDGVIPNAGIADGEPAEHEPAAVYDRVLSVNVSQGANLAAAAARHLMDAGHGGWVIMQSSILAHRAGTGGGVAAYCASKAAVEALVRELARQWAPHGIRVNALSPGYFPTEMNAAMTRAPGRAQALVARIPMARSGEPSDLAGAVVFLASDAARYITGHTLAIDGGMSVW